MRYMTVRKFASESGYTEDAIRSKIRDGIWRLGEIWHKAPDGRTLIDMEGYETWVPAVLRKLSCGLCSHSSASSKDFIQSFPGSRLHAGHA